MKEVRRDPSLGILINSLRPPQKKLLKEIFHYDEQGILEPWVDTLPPIKKRHSKVLIEMILAEINVIQYEDTVGTLQRGGRILLEKVGLSKTVSQMLIREGFRVQELPADKDKITKALPLSARMESGDVLLKAEAPWLPDLERELLTFPLGAHDDMVDALALGAQEMQKRRIWEA